jgi:hypothetical protein
MADDTTIFVEDLASLKCVLKLISLFHIFAGLKLNIKKTEAMWMGNLRNSKDTPLGLKWVNEVHSLGIFFSYDTDYVIQKNFTDKSKAFKKILDLWSQRDLSLIGKITILKSLAFSMITYQCCSLSVPTDFIDTINDIAFKFLWSNKKDKVKRKTIIADYENGGLRMLDIQTFIKAQQIMWVKRLFKGGDASWKAYPHYALSKLIGKNSFNCNTSYNKKLNINKFYLSILEYWTEIQNWDSEHMTAIDIREQCLWLNKNIKIDNKEVKWSTWMEHNIFLIHDILDSKGNFLSINSIEQLFGLKCHFLKYNSIKDAIPKSWREKLKTIDVPRNNININENLHIKINNQQIPLNLINNKMAYWKLIEKIQIPHVTKAAWEDELKVDKNEWKHVFNIPLVIRDTKIRTFQYKLILNLIPCNQYLFRIKRHDTNICNYCPAEDNITHYFYECTNTKQFWLGFQNWWNQMQNDDIIITDKIALVGLIGNMKVFNKINACIQLARWYIYCEKLNLQEPFLYRFLCQLRYKIKIEKIICQRNGTTKKYANMWESIEEYLD